jgi:hypothetical protein
MCVGTHLNHPNEKVKQAANDSYDATPSYLSPLKTAPFRCRVQHSSEGCSAEICY